jgi:hypothetical protein
LHGYGAKSFTDGKAVAEVAAAKPYIAGNYNVYVTGINIVTSSTKAAASI